jgi:hypothetical protein
MKMIQMTKLVSGYIPSRVWVNPDKVIYIEELVSRRGQGGDAYVEVPMGTRLQFGDDNRIDVKETPDTVVQWLQWELGGRERATTNGVGRDD